MEKDSTLKVTLLDSTKSSLYCDCVYFSPAESQENIFALGLYQLEEQEKITKGGFCLYAIEKGFFLFPLKLE